MLETLHPGRIDLGIGRAPGSDARTALALRRGVEAPDGPGVPDPWAESAVSRFPEQVGDLIGFLTDGLPPDHRFASVQAMPAGPGVPEVWLLGSTDASAACAAHFGTAFSFAHFINADGGAAVTRAYVRAFRPSPSLGAARASAAVFAVCADTEAEAERLSRSRDLFIVRLYTGQGGPLPVRRGGRALPVLAARAGHRRARPPAHGGRGARAGARALARSLSRLWCRRASRRHHHPRPEGAAPLLRAPRRRIRAPSRPSMTLRIGALCWNQYTDWPALLEAGKRADRLGYESLWTWDHLYPIVGRLERSDPRGVDDARRVGAGRPHGSGSG